ncbi:MAG: hypothetical protein JXA67_22300 [Micromonosporaceae bacterium]|nr:hypothetical protein [Micromonosporaceae bacterium]
MIRTALVASDAAGITDDHDTDGESAALDTRETTHPTIHSPREARDAEAGGGAS